MRFIKKLLKESIEGDVRLDRLPDVYVDTATLIYEQLGLESLSLEDAATYLRIPYKANHSALEDAKVTREIYRMLSQANGWQRWWWRWRAPK
jgi:DNA polymerase III epsilon subunit-like protein